LENLGTEVEINISWETIRDHIKISAKESLGYYEFKKHKPWFNEGCSKLFDQRQQAKLDFSQAPSKIHVYMGYPNNIRCEASEHLRNKRENI
jgi:hypothetical protein